MLNVMYGVSFLLCYILITDLWLLMAYTSDLVQCQGLGLGLWMVFFKVSGSGHLLTGSWVFAFSTKEDIDAGMKSGTNQPTGLSTPLELADFVELGDLLVHYVNVDRFLFQCPCCSCFCFMKPKKGKPKEKEAKPKDKEAKPKDKESKETKPKEKEAKDEKKTE
ncbi:hypothetical protein L1987_70621 [Smallanthus sonchifolius]|uniref:Uncharacterized protein n=1 Tax=Smallanthus sonchifolius TaxID=185202 RepID=A0ACB9APE1_9ASTR|nr:hypothetical protein L1987_70621 [Smallanthus sonchifolius]